MPPSPVPSGFVCASRAGQQPRRDFCCAPSRYALTPAARAPQARAAVSAGHAPAVPAPWRGAPLRSRCCRERRDALAPLADALAPLADALAQQVPQAARGKSGPRARGRHTHAAPTTGAEFGVRTTTFFASHEVERPKLAQRRLERQSDTPLCAEVLRATWLGVQHGCASVVGALDLRVERTRGHDLARTALALRREGSILSVRNPRANILND